MRGNDKPWIKSEEIAKRKSYLIRTGIVLAVILVLILAVGHFHFGSTDDTKQGTAKLASLESMDVSENQETIDKLRAQRDADILDPDANLETKFSGTIVMGDSLAWELIEYKVLPSSCVVAKCGAGTADADNAFAAAAARNPSKIVLDYGLDDLTDYKADADGFISQYGLLIDSLKARFPGAKLYLCSITPASPDILSLVPEYGYYSVYNTALVKLCGDKGVTYIDVTDLVTDYSSDGIHPAATFLTPWAKRIAEKIG